MTTPQSEKPGGIGLSDIFALSFFGCFILVLYSIIPLLTIMMGILTIMQGLIFWGTALIILGVMAFIGPFYAASRSKEVKEKSTEKPDNV